MPQVHWHLKCENLLYFFIFFSVNKDLMANYFSPKQNVDFTDIMAMLNSFPSSAKACKDFLSTRCCIFDGQA